MRRVMHEIDIFVLPSLTEGLPNVALEAFACAKPVVATRVGGSPEVVEDGSCGYLVEPGDPRALCERILALAASGEARRTFGRRGRCLVERRFDFSAQTREYAHLYRRLGGFGTCIGSRGESR
jgi:glycosyltransferase involved in cell wall biosynthesis